MLTFTRPSRLRIGLEIFFVFYATLAFAQPDPTRVLIGRWEGSLKGPIRGPKERTLTIRSVEPTETGWVARGGFWVEVGVRGFRIRDGIDVSLEDGLIVLRFRNPGNDTYRLVLTANNRLEGTMDFVQYRAGGNSARTIHVTLEKKVRPRKVPEE